MAEDQPAKGRRIRKAETVRERALKAQTQKPKPRRLRGTAVKAVRPLHTAHKLATREYYLPMPDNRAGKFLNKKRNVIPRYFYESFAELRQVIWPSFKETWRLTVAVAIFSLVLTAVIFLTDFVLGKIFRKVFLD